VARRLGDLRLPSCVPLLARLLMDRDAHVREAAVSMLDKFPASDEVAHLLLGCLNDPASQVRRSAAWGLRDLKQAFVAEGLVAHVHDPSPPVRKAILAALSGRSSDLVVPVLLQGLEEVDGAIRGSAAFALGRTAQEPALTERFIRLLRQANPDVREVAVQALPLRHRPELCQLAARHLDDEDSRVRQKALDVLFQQRYPAAEARLRAELQHTTPAKRRKALKRLAEERDRIDYHLVSCDFDALDPFRDPRWPVTMGQVRLAAWRLGLPVDEVQQRYEALSTEFSLPLTWQVGS
jgi:HEAT repeat protein